MTGAIIDRLNAALNARESLLNKEKHESAFRLFNGFLEGWPSLSVDIYARTALLHNYADTRLDSQTTLARDWINEKLAWVDCIIGKERNGQTQSEKRGSILYGSSPDRKVLENAVRYEIDLTMNRDASLYLDTRNLRLWAQQNLTGKTVLNAFAYTGSLGVAALAGGAERVIQLDRNESFLSLAKNSYQLNGFLISKKDFIVDDFFPAVSQLKQSGQSFDCVFLDPPFFATTPKGRVDLATGSTRLINKIRPLINHDGWLVTINNALYVSGKDYMASLDALCQDGYLRLEQLVSIPQDFTGFPATRVGNPPVDPSPFNHSTKIAILRIRRKSSSIEK